MWLCIVCHFEVEFDDTVVRRGDGRCICLRCQERLADATPRLDKQLSDDVRRTADGAE